MSDTNRRLLWLSVRPRFAELILRGKKQVELRRVRPDLRKGDMVVIYASAPTMAVVGFFWVDFIIVDDPSVIWKLARQRAALSHAEYCSYFSGASQAVGIYVREPTPFRRPVSLADIRSMWPGFSVPQSYRYLSMYEAERLLEAGRTRVSHQMALVQ